MEVCTDTLFLGTNLTAKHAMLIWLRGLKPVLYGLRANYSTCLADLSSPLIHFSEAVMFRKVIFALVLYPNYIDKFYNAALWNQFSFYSCHENVSETISFVVKGQLLITICI